VREVQGSQKIAIPIGAVVRGGIEKLGSSSKPDERAHLLLRFTSLDLPGRASLKLVGRVKEVENARETILPDGTIQGVLADEVPLSRLEAAVGKMGKDNQELGEIVQAALGKTDTSVEFPDGTDIEYVLDRPLTVEGGFEPAVPASLSPAQPPQPLNCWPRRHSGPPAKKTNRVTLSICW
jgi:hypothetical protein